jgi:DNA topoisomerase-1
MEGLTAKVFRTYNASKLFQTELNEINSQIDKMGKDDSNKINLILDMYNKANVKVAVLCNHQKNVSKSFNEQVKKIDEKITELKAKKKELEKEKESIGKEDKDKIKKINEKIHKVRDKIDETENKKDLKMELKNLSLTTSKTNYIDPRITIAFFRKHKLPLEKIFSPTLMDKFFWAMDVSEDWVF